MPEGCLFCRIVAKEIPAKVVLETDKVLAFRDINPQAPVHILVIPKTHIENTMALKTEHSPVLFDIFRSAQEIARQEGVDKSGFRLNFNNGPDAGQAVSHLHLHILGKRKLGWPPG